MRSGFLLAVGLAGGLAGSLGLAAGCGDDGGGTGGSDSSGSSGSGDTTTGTPPTTNDDTTTSEPMTGGASSTGTPPDDTGGSTTMGPGDTTMDPTEGSSESTAGAEPEYPPCMLQMDPVCPPPYDICYEFELPDYSVCTQPCQQDDECPMPASGDAMPVCAGQGFDQCLLDCSGGATCPDGMECVDVANMGMFFRCLWPSA